MSENEKQEILMMVGLPASGKTTFAVDLCNSAPHLWMRVNKDEIRKEYPDFSERTVIDLQNKRIRDYLSSGYSVVVDDTNLNPFHMKRLKEIAKEYGAVFNIHPMMTPIKECIARDSMRENKVGEDVIVGMNKRWMGNNRVYPWIDKLEDEQSNSLPIAVIVDIDGTLALSTGRSPYACHLAGYDALNIPVAETIHALTLAGYRLIYVSGREDTYYDVTKEWIERTMGYFETSHGFRALYMRKEGDRRSDDIVKRELFHNYIRDNYRVLCVFDDRPRVRRMWISEGLFVFSAYQDPDMKEF